MNQIKNKKHLLIIDDDKRIRNLIKKYLEKYDFIISTARNAEHSKKLMKNFVFDLLVIDIMMPGENGIILTRKIRKEKKTPILLLTALSDVKQRILGLESGADDYLIKPFEPRELVLRIQSIINRYGNSSNETSKVEQMHFGELSFNIEKNILFKGSLEIHLTTNETKLLVILIKYINKVISRETIAICLKDFYKDLNVENRTIDVQINRLRQKLEKNPKFPKYLKTVRSRGYILIND